MSTKLSTAASNGKSESGRDGTRRVSLMESGTLLEADCDYV
jgi:hypothetical protein